MRHVASSLAPSLPLSHQGQDVSWGLFMWTSRSLLFFQHGNHPLVTWLDQSAAFKRSLQGQLIIYLSQGLLLKLSSLSSCLVAPRREPALQRSCSWVLRWVQATGIISAGSQHPAAVEWSWVQHKLRRII